MLAEILERLGEPWTEDIRNDLGIEKPVKVADFFHNGGFELHHEDTGENISVAYVALENGEVKIGCWVWYDGHDFDMDAEWLVLDERDFEEQELTDIYRQIEKIYGK